MTTPEAAGTISGAKKNNGRYRRSFRLFYPWKNMPPLSTPLLAVLTMVLVFGLIMLFSASYVEGYFDHDGNSFFFISQQVICAGIGFVLMLIISFTDYRVWHSLAWMLYLGCLGPLVLVLFLPPVEVDGKFFHRWIQIGSLFSIQVSEIAKFALIVIVAHLMEQYEDKLHTLKYGVAIPGVLALIMCALVWIEPHHSGALLLLLILATMLISGGSSLKWLSLAGAGGVAALGLAFLLDNATFKSRIQNWSLISGQLVEYQTRQSLYAIALGGLKGVGICNSTQKHLWLPMSSNDYIFPVLCEELGFLGAVLCIVLFAVLIIQCIYISANSPDRFGAVLGIGITGQIAWQVICNLFVVTDLMPSTGITLPFFSSGGTSILLLLCEMGVMLSLSRAVNARKAKEAQATQAEPAMRAEE